LGADSEENRNRDEDSAEEINPVAEGVESRKGYVPRADLERNQKIEERCREGHDREEDHGRSVHSEELVVELGRHEVLIGSTELRADDECLHAPEREKEERGIEVQNANALVVYGAEPAPETRMFARVFAAVRRG